MKVLVRELKFALAPERAPLLLEWLRNHCEPERPHGEGPVNSVYFDTPDWRHLREKVNSDYLKSKLRVRWYDPSASGTGFVEVKRKIGAARTKQRRAYPVTPPELASRRLDDPAWHSVPSFAAELGLTPAGPMYPALTISYHRRRFIEPTLGLRLNLDCEIRVSAVNPEMMPTAQPALLPVAVFEAKGEIDRLPPSLYPVIQFGARRRAYSKYLAGWLAASNRAIL